MTEQEMLKQIYEHMMTMNREMGAVQAQVEMLSKVFWIVLTASVGAAVASIWSLVLYRSNNKKV